MSFSNTIHVSGASQHFERIARALMQKRRSRDVSTCDLRIDLRDGFDMMHSVVACAHSTTIAKSIENCRPPYAPLDMSSFETDSVRRIIDWMYTGEINILPNALSQDLAVAANLRVAMLQREFEMYLLSVSENGNAIKALNDASTESFLVTDETMINLVLNLHRNLKKMTDNELIEIKMNTILAILSTLLPAEKKIPLINLAIRWMNLKKLDRIGVHVLVQSIVISDMTYESLYNVRFLLNDYLTNKAIAHRAKVHLSSDGTVMLSVAPLKSGKKSKRTIDGGHGRTRSEVSMINSLPDPFGSNINIARTNKRVGRTESEMQLIESLPNPFVDNSEKSSSIRSGKSGSQGSLRGAEYKKLGRTNSELKVIKDMPDPFSSSLRSSRSKTRCRKLNRTPSEVSHINGLVSPFSKSSQMLERNSYLKRSQSEINHINELTDPFSSICQVLDRNNNLIRTKSEVNHINDLPDPFVTRSSDKSCKRRRARSDDSMIRQLPDPFVPSSQQLTSASTTESLDTLTDPFQQNFVVVQPAKRSSSTKKFVKPKIMRTQSEQSVLNALPDPFDSSYSIASPNIVGAQKLNRSGSEIDFIRQMPDPFQESQRRSSPIVQYRPTSQRDGVQKFYTRSEANHIKRLADPFKDRKQHIRELGDNDKIKITDDQRRERMVNSFNRPACMTNNSQRSGSVKKSPFEENSKAYSCANKSSQRVPKVIKHPYPKSSNNAPAKSPQSVQSAKSPIVMAPLKGCVSPYVSKHSARSNESMLSARSQSKKPDFLISGHVGRTVSEIKEIQMLPPVFEELSKKKEKKFEGSFRLYPS